MLILKAISLGKHSSATLNKQLTLPKAVLKPALSSVPPASLRGTVSANDAAVKNLDVIFRVFENEEGGLKSITLEHDRIKASLSSAQSYKWDDVLDSLTPSQDRDTQLTDLLGLPLKESAQSQGVPQGLPQYQSALLLSPLSSKDEDSFTDIRLNDPVYSARTEGEPDSFSFRTFLQEEGADVSPWHDIALFNEDGTLNFFCEIPMDTTAKFEVATAEYNNPIKQDIKKGELRHYHDAIPYNYGMLPQTWEDPAASSSILPGIGGDNDPVDVVEISGRPLQSGGVYHVKFLGAYAMIDGGELDWKILCINVDSPLAAKLDTIQDVERELPGELERIMVWFRDYKKPDGKPENAFGFDSTPIDKEMARLVINETHDAYKALKDGQRVNDSDLSLR